MHPPLRNALVSGILTGSSFILAHAGLIPPDVEIALFAIAIPIGAYHWAREGIENLVREHVIGIEILMLAATVGSAVLGLWDEAAFLVFLYGAAEGVEELSYARTRSSIRKLLDLAPKEAVILEKGYERTIPADKLGIGDSFIVKPGASIPTDGIIVKGQSTVNEAAVTGESLPVLKKEGMKIFAATINGEGLLEARATASFQDNTLSRIIHLVEDAQEQKGKVQLFIERFGRIYSPIVLLAAFLMIGASLFISIPGLDLANRGVVLLVAAAPCALVMSTPIAVAAGIGAAGKEGILVKGGAHLENLGKIKAIACDKTGTLTLGEPVVTDIVPLAADQTRVLDLASSVERCSEHPLARAVLREAEARGIRGSEAIEGCAIPGHGVKATVGGVTIYVGEPDLFVKLGLDISHLTDIDRLKKEGKTVILAGTEDTLCGIIAAKDQIRPEAKTMVDQLRSMGVGVVMLTGDNLVVAQQVASSLGIAEVMADLSPEDKIASVDRLKERYGAVAMIGDGINDAPALAKATTGIAMGAIGTDAAIEAADVALMADDLAKVPEALEFGRKARKISTENIVFSVLVLAILIPSALTGILSVAAAVVFHEGSELLAVANGLRMMKR